MAEEYTATSLSKKTVVQLKELLATHSLPVTGKKDDLIQRLLAHSQTLSEPATTDTTGAASAVDEPDGQGHSGTAEVSQAANATTERGAEEVVDGTRTAPGSTEAAGELDAGGAEAKGEEEEALKKQAREAEEEKRRKRAERFGGGAAASASAGPSEEELAKLKRAEKFGINVAAEKEGEKEGGKLDKSLALLDAPLGSQRRQGREKPAPTSKSSAPANGGGVTNAAAATEKKAGGGVSAAEAAAEPAAAVAADPELKRKLEEEEEKKRKRAERFGGPPAEKKAKLDDSAAAPAPETTTA